MTNDNAALSTCAQKLTDGVATQGADLFNGQEVSVFSRAKASAVQLPSMLTPFC